MLYKTLSAVCAAVFAAGMALPVAAQPGLIPPPALPGWFKSDCAPIRDDDLRRRLPRALSYRDGVGYIGLWAAAEDGLALRRFRAGSGWEPAWRRYTLGAELPDASVLPPPQDPPPRWSRSLPVEVVYHDRSIFNGSFQLRLPTFLPSFGFYDHSDESQIGLPLLEIDVGLAGGGPVARVNWRQQRLEFPQQIVRQRNFKYQTSVRDDGGAHFFGIDDQNDGNLYRYSVEWTPASVAGDPGQVSTALTLHPEGSLDANGLPLFQGVDPGPNSATSVTLAGVKHHFVFVKATPFSGAGQEVRLLFSDGNRWVWEASGIGAPVANAQIEGEPLVYLVSSFGGAVYTLGVVVVARDPQSMREFRLYEKRFELFPDEPFSALNETQDWRDLGTPDGVAPGAPFRMTTALVWNNGLPRVNLFGYTDEPGDVARLLEFYFDNAGGWRQGMLLGAPDGSGQVRAESSLAFEDGAYRRLSVFARTASGAIYELSYEPGVRSWRWDDLSCSAGGLLPDWLW